MNEASKLLNFRAAWVGANVNLMRMGLERSQNPVFFGLSHRTHPGLHALLLARHGRPIAGIQHQPIDHDVRFAQSTHREVAKLT